VARTLADALGGRIEVESVLAKGSTFSLTLPRKSLDDQR
jgi:signal transduction histidine kinase